MVKETSTLAAGRPTILDEKRRMQRELGLDVEPAFVMPKGNLRDPMRRGPWRKFSDWLKGAP